MTQLDGLKGDLNKFCTLFDTMGTHLTNAGSKYQEASRQLDHFTDKLTLAGSANAQDSSLPIERHSAGAEKDRTVQEPLRLA